MIDAPRSIASQSSAAMRGVIVPERMMSVIESGWGWL